MQARQSKMYLSRRLPCAVEERAGDRYTLVRNSEDTILAPEDLIAGAQGCAYILTSAMQPIPRVVLVELKGTLKAIGTLSVGYNHIDLDAAREFGVAVFYSPSVLSDACADLAVMLLLNAARRGYEADSMMRTNMWPGFAPTQLMGIGLSGRRVGILGMGRIGQATAKRLRHLEWRCITTIATGSVRSWRTARCITRRPRACCTRAIFFCCWRRKFGAGGFFEPRADRVASARCGGGEYLPGGYGRRCLAHRSAAERSNICSGAGCVCQ